MTTMTPRKRKPKSEKELARNKEYQKEYYAKNKDDLLKKKQERYAGDPEYRRGVRIRSRRKLWLGERLDQKQFPPFGDITTLKPRGEIHITVDEPEDARVGQTLTVPVYSSAAVAELLGRAPEVLRLWWKRKQLPEPFHRGADVPEKMIKGKNPRLFTGDELRAVDKVKEYLNLPSKGASHEIFARELEKEFAQMRRGLYVERDKLPAQDAAWTRPE